MEQILLEFVNTLELSLKNLQQRLGPTPGFSKLTINQFRYIDAIFTLGQPAITEIADQLNITKASATVGIKRLVKMGYITKIQSNEDRRVFRAGLTTAGEELVKAKYLALKEYGEFIRASLSEDEARQFEQTLAKIVRLFKL